MASIAATLERLRNASFASDKRSILAQLKVSVMVDSTTATWWARERAAVTAAFSLSPRAPRFSAQESSSAFTPELTRKGVPIFLKTLRAQPRDVGLSQTVMEILLDLLGVRPTAAEACRATLADPSAVAVLLDHLKQSGLWVRLSTLGVLTALVRESAEGACAALQRTRTGISAIVDVLGDPRVEVRNEVLGLLSLVTEASTELRNVLAFDDGFERLLRVVSSSLAEGEEGGQEGADSGEGEGQTGEGAAARRPSLTLQSLIVVADCLTIVRHVLRGNELAQRLFIEGRHLTACVGVLDLPARLAEAGASHPALVQHVRLCLMLLLGVVDELVHVRVGLREWQAGSGTGGGLSGADSAALLSAGAVRSAADAVCNIPGLLDGLACAAFSVSKAGCDSVELRGAAVLNLAGVAAASPIGRVRISELLVLDADAALLDGEAEAAGSASAPASPRFALALTCAARALIGCNSRIVRDSAATLLHAMMLGRQGDQGPDARTALLTHALAPPPVPLPNFLLPVALAGAPARFVAAGASTAAGQASDVMATVVPPGQALLAGLLRAINVLAQGGGRVASAPELYMARRTVCLVSCLLASVVHPGNAWDTSASELLLRLPSARVLPGAATDETIFSRILGVLSTALRTGARGSEADGVMALLLTRVVLASTAHCPPAVAAMWRGLKDANLAGLLAAAPADAQYGWPSATCAAAIAASCWRYAEPPPPAPGGLTPSGKSRRVPTGDHLTRRSIEQDIVSGGLGGSPLPCIQSCLHVGLTQEWVAAALARSPVRVGADATPSGEGLIAIDAQYGMQLLQLLVELEREGGLESTTARWTEAPAPAAGAAAVPLLPTTAAGVAEPAPSPDGPPSPDAAVVSATFAAANEAWETERGQWDAAVRERDAFISGQAEQIAALLQQLEAARAGAPSQLPPYVPFQPAPPSATTALPDGYSTREEVEALVGEWREAVSERDTLLRAMEAELARARAEPVASVDTSASVLRATVSGAESLAASADVLAAGAEAALGEARAEAAKLRHELSSARAAYSDLQGSTLSSASAERDRHGAEERTLRARLAEAEARAVAQGVRAEGLLASSAAAQGAIAGAAGRAEEAARSASDATAALAPLMAALGSANRELSSLGTEHEELLVLLALRDEERAALRDAIGRQEGGADEVARVDAFLAEAMARMAGAASGATLSGGATSAWGAPAPAPVARAPASANTSVAYSVGLSISALDAEPVQAAPQWAAYAPPPHQAPPAPAPAQQQAWPPRHAPAAPPRAPAPPPEPVAAPTPANHSHPSGSHPFAHESFPPDSPAPPPDLFRPFAEVLGGSGSGAGAESTQQQWIPQDAAPPAIRQSSRPPSGRSAAVQGGGGAFLDVDLDGQGGAPAIFVSAPPAPAGHAQAMFGGHGAGFPSSIDGGAQPPSHGPHHYAPQYAAYPPQYGDALGQQQGGYDGGPGAGARAAASFFGADEGEGNSGGSDGPPSAFPLFSFVGGLVSNVAKSVVNEGSAVMRAAGGGRGVGGVMGGLMQQYGGGGQPPTTPEMYGGGVGGYASEAPPQQPMFTNTAVPEPPAMFSGTAGGPAPMVAARWGAGLPAAAEAHPQAAPFGVPGPSYAPAGFFNPSAVTGQGQGRAAAAAGPTGGPGFYGGLVPGDGTTMQPYGGPLYRNKARLAARRASGSS
jgi:hypothetical protein